MKIWSPTTRHSLRGVPAIFLCAQVADRKRLARERNERQIELRGKGRHTFFVIVGNNDQLDAACRYALCPRPHAGKRRLRAVRRHGIIHIEHDHVHIERFKSSGVSSVTQWSVPVGLNTAIASVFASCVAREKPVYTKKRAKSPLLHV